jgi:hypothetical protein
MSGTVVVIHPNGKTEVRDWPGALDRDMLPEGTQGVAFFQELLGDHYFEVVAASWDGQARRAFRVDDEGWPERLVENPHARALLTAPYRDLVIVGPMLIWIPPQ